MFLIYFQSTSSSENPKLINQTTYISYVTIVILNAQSAIYFRRFRFSSGSSFVFNLWVLLSLWYFLCDIRKWGMISNDTTIDQNTNDVLHYPLSSECSHIFLKLIRLNFSQLLNHELTKVYKCFNEFYKSVCWSTYLLKISSQLVQLASGISIELEQCKN